MNVDTESPEAVPERDLHTVELHLELLNDYLDSDLNEVCINKPGTLFTYGAGKWTEIPMPEITFEWCNELAKLIANYSGQSPDDALSADMPGGHRIEIALPPVALYPSITIRIPKRGEPLTLEQILEFGSFEKTRWLMQTRGITADERIELQDELTDADIELLELFHAKDAFNFLVTAVEYRCNIFLSGRTGSGKTALLNALGAKIPLDERPITCEDTRESRLPHRNQVNLIYRKDPSAPEKYRAKGVLASTLRQFPSRVLLAEIRGDEAYFFFSNVANSGQPGSLATLHASSAKMAIRRMSNLIQASPEGSRLPLDVIIRDLYALVNVVIQTDIDKVTGKPYVREIYFDPAYALRAAW
ncbi:ATPase, T2SS/T4P/T4SS family [Pseudomonas viridiflava]|uniref:ATPase, T2SS/T4P/T4SS family n=1 Tax=Pseudomonas viridiflava TaxID=33069 RepID=UPI000F034330|nr:ATPase, T2SS/T4P/T4SS family [Pseudomonas viridiflava]